MVWNSDFDRRSANMNRPAIPTQLERELLVEAGHRCAIPTCRQTPVDFAHIVPWEKCQKHEFDNMICLCPTCHRRYDAGEIDQKAMYIYKRNLAKLTGRYGDIELRILTFFAENRSEMFIDLPIGLDILVLNLLKDNLLLRIGGANPIQFTNRPSVISWMPTATRYQVTPKGLGFIKRWVSAEEIE